MLNHIDLMGRLTRDPELRRTGIGTSVASFTIACARDFKNQQTGQTEVDFIDCVAWRGTAEMLCKHFTKGRMIGLSGRLQVRTWMDQDGAKRKAAEVIADSIYFADSKPSSGAGQQQENVQSDADPECSGYPIIEDDGEFPF